VAILDKVLSNVNACAIEVAFNGTPTPSIIALWQPFYNTLIPNATFSKAAASISTINFSEESATTSAGTSYTQTATWSFPEMDAFRSDRIALLHTIKFIKFKFTNGLSLIVGRNDFEQNTDPKIKMATNGKTISFSVEVKSMSPAGFIPTSGAYGLPTFVPVTL